MASTDTAPRAAIPLFSLGFRPFFLGAGIWAAIAHFANFELGWIAWGVGALAGLGVRVAADNEATDMGGVVAVLCAIIGLSAGKYAAVYMDVNEITSEFGFDSDPEHAAHVRHGQVPLPDVHAGGARRERHAEWRPERCRRGSLRAVGSSVVSEVPTKSP